MLFVLYISDVRLFEILVLTSSKETKIEKYQTQI